MKKYIIILFAFISSFAYSQYDFQAICLACAEQEGFYCGDDPTNWTQYSPNGCVQSSWINDGWEDCLDTSDENTEGPTLPTECAPTPPESCDTVFITLTELEFIFDVGNWDLTAGVVGRIHPVYGVNPIRDFWVPGSSNFQDIAQDFGYAPEQWVQGFYVDQNWYDVSSGDSVLLATSNDEFFNHYFGEAVARFNERELDKLGLQRELSAVIGVAYYKYTNKMWLHAWANCLPIHHGLDEYSFEYGKQDNDNIEWDAGIVLGTRVTKNLGLFVEGIHMKYWGKEVFEVKFGFNYLIF